MKIVLVLLLLINIFSACSKKKANRVNSFSQNGSNQLPPTAGPVPTMGPGNPYQSNPPGNTAPTPTPYPTWTASLNPKQPVYGDAQGSSPYLCSEIQGSGVNDWNYYRLNAKGHGHLRSGAVWNSLDNYTDSWDRSIFTSDQTLQVRIKLLPNPMDCDLSGTECYDNQGNITDCTKVLNQNYSKLSLKLALKDPQNNTFEEIEFKDVKVGECSPVRYFRNLPLHDESNPYILEVKGVKSDYHCKTRGAPFCDYVNMAWSACWQINIDMATDSTNGIPRL